MFKECFSDIGNDPIYGPVVKIKYGKMGKFADLIVALSFVMVPLGLASLLVVRSFMYIGLIPPPQSNIYAEREYVVHRDTGLRYSDEK